jgi:AcrR family transcriptional regulator
MTQTRREKQREATHDEIKAIAKRQIYEVGSSNLSLRGIAAEMGITAPAIYRYFDSRDALVTALIVDAYNSLADALTEASNRPDPQDYATRFLAVCLEFREWALSHRAEFILIYGTPIPGYHAPEEITTPAAIRSNVEFMQLLEFAWVSGQIIIPAEYSGIASPFHNNLVEIFKRYGLTMPPPLLHVTLTGWALIMGLVSLELYGQFDYLGENVGEMYRQESIAYLTRLGLHPAI